jgi:hypothetical protein
MASKLQFISAEFVPQRVPVGLTAAHSGWQRRWTRMNGINTQYVPLRDAVLCDDCNFVSAGEVGICPVCRGRSLSRLARLLPEREKHSAKMGVQVVLELLGFRRRPRRSDLGFATRAY